MTEILINLCMVLLTLFLPEGGGQFSSFFSFGVVFFQKIGCLDFLNFRKYGLLVFRGPWGDLGRYLSKKVALTINLRPFAEFRDTIP